MRLSFLILFYFCSLTLSVAAQAADDKMAGTSPTYQVSGNALLLTQFIDRGLSMSDGNPAMNASFLFNLGSQFKIGFWGSNISNLSNADDNFWLKTMAEVKVDFNDRSAMRFYIHDDHYFKAEGRNGQEIGIYFDYLTYTFQFEWMTNYQGSHSTAEYFNFGRFFIYKTDFRYGGKIGYSQQRAQDYYNLKNYFDLKAYSSYQMTTNTYLELGATIISESSQFNGRGDPAFYLSVGLKF